MFNIHETILDVSSIKNKSNKQILTETTKLRQQKRSVLLIEDFYLKCKNKNFIMRLHQIKELNSRIRQKFWIQPTLPYLDSITRTIKIEEGFQMHSFRCGYLLPLQFPKSTLLYNAMNQIHSRDSDDGRLRLMMKQIFQYGWIMNDLYNFLEYCHYLQSSDMVIGTNAIYMNYDYKELYKMIIVKRIDPKLKKLKLHGLFYLCTMLPLEMQHGYALLFQPLLSSIDSIVSLVLLFDSQSILTISHYFYKCKPLELYTTLSRLFNCDSPVELAQFFTKLTWDHSRQFLFNSITMLHLYLCNTFDHVLLKELESIKKLCLFLFNLTQNKLFLTLDHEKEDYDPFICPLISHTIYLIRLLCNRHQAHFNWHFPLFWNPSLKSISASLLSSTSLHPSDSLANLLDYKNITHSESTVVTELSLLAINPFHFQFIDRLQLFHVIYPRCNQFTMSENYIKIDRNNILQCLFKLDFASVIKIEFINEQGVDGGGLYQEFMSLLLQHVCDYYFISFNDSYIFNVQAKPFKVANSTIPILNAFYSIGQLIARCLREDIVLPFQLNPYIYFLLMQPSHTKLNVNALWYYDTSYYHQLMQLFHLNVDDLELSQSITIQGIDLVLDHTTTSVTNANKLNYILAINSAIYNFYAPFVHQLYLGIHSLIDVLWFDMNELQMMLHGQLISCEDIIANLHLNNYLTTDKEIQWLFKVLREMNQEELQLFVQFVTGRERLPVMGASQLDPKMGLSKMTQQEHQILLPTSATCMNLLKLPEYSSELELKRKLMMALKETRGFQLS